MVEDRRPVFPLEENELEVGVTTWGVDVKGSVPLEGELECWNSEVEVGIRLVETRVEEAAGNELELPARV